MKKIKLLKMTLCNWRGEKERTTVFSADAPTSISGGNGLGKSRHFDAFCWLLFGKDSKNRTDYELRTYDERHQPLHRCECSVEATLWVDGEELTIKREWREKWVKPKGQAEEVFDGNGTECTWNGVPVTKTEYAKRVKDAIIDDELFKMITNPHYFLVRMSWQQQRETLTLMAGTASDYEIAAGSEDFTALLDELGGKSLADFRKEVAATKKRLKAEAAEIQPRIDQTQKMMPEAEDWVALDKELATIHEKIVEIDMQIGDAGLRCDVRLKKQNDIKAEIYERKARQADIVRKRKAEAQEECDRKNESRREIEADLKRAHAALSDTTIDKKRNAERTASLQRELGHTGKELEELRKEWYEINSTAYDESGDTCPCCGQRLPEGKIQEARDAFKARKAERLRRNNASGQLLVEKRKRLEAELADLVGYDEKLKTRLEFAEAETKRLAETLIDTPAATAEEVKPDTIAAWREETFAIEELEAKLKELDGGDDASNVVELRTRKGELQKQNEALRARLQKRGQIEEAEEEIGRLVERGRELAQQIADLEKREYTAAQFSRKRIEDCEARINGMFKTVRFKLFDQTQDGNEYETCVPLIDGVPYPVANTAAQVNAGLDIIDTLCKFNNVSAPIFIDGAESVNDYLECSSQTIFLRVTEDKELVVSYEL